MDKTMDRHLVICALLMAVWKRQSADSVLVHSDHSSHYGSADYLAFMRDNNLERSMNRRGNYHDNAVAESFFATLKNMLRKE
jgi:putative transposase